MQKKNRSRKTHDATNKTANLAVKTNGPKTARRREGYIRSIVPKTLSRTRSDIATWRSALRAADNVDNPRRVRRRDALRASHLADRTAAEGDAPDTFRDQGRRRDRRPGYGGPQCGIMGHGAQHPHPRQRDVRSYARGTHDDREHNRTRGRHPAAPAERDSREGNAAVPGRRQ